VSVSTRSIADALATIVGASGVVAEPVLTLDGVRPRWLVAPASVEQLAALVALAREASLSVCPLGSGSTLELGVPVDHIDVAVDLCQLDAILEDNPEDLTITVQAGVTLDAVYRRLTPRRQLLPIDPPGGRSRTLGGIAATHAHGPLRTKYRTIRDLLLGVRFVQADGVVTWGGARVVKSVTGYDVPKLMVGALGTLGVLAELTLRLQPMPDCVGNWIATFPAVESAGAFVARLLDSVVQPSRLEILNAETMRASGLDGVPAAVAVSIGSVEDAVRAGGAMVSAFAAASDGRAVAASATFWDEYERAASPSSRRTWLKIATLPSRVAEIVRAAEGAGAAAGAPVAVTGAAALGVLRVGVPDVTPDAGARLVASLRETVAGHGGSVVIERAPRELRARVDPWGPVEPGALTLMRSLKQQFDPAGTLNVGRFVGGI
jgi:glycolate oxidase FAD binding subunit